MRIVTQFQDGPSSRAASQAYPMCQQRTQSPFFSTLTKDCTASHHSTSITNQSFIWCFPFAMGLRDCHRCLQACYLDCWFIICNAKQVDPIGLHFGGQVYSCFRAGFIFQR